MIVKINNDLREALLEEEDNSSKLKIQVDGRAAETLEEVLVMVSKRLPSKAWIDIDRFYFSDYRDIVAGWMYENAHRQVWLQIRLQERLLLDNYRDVLMLYGVFSRALQENMLLAKVKGFDDRGLDFGRNFQLWLSLVPKQGDELLPPTALRSSMTVHRFDD